MKKGEKNDFTFFANMLTFDVFTSILFGDDKKELADKCRPYLNPDGSVENIPLREHMLKVFKCYYAQFFHPLTSICRYISDYNLVNPFKRDYENMKMFQNGMKELYKQSKDPSSVSSLIMKNKEFQESEKRSDLNAFVFAGAETSSHGIVSTLFFLKKYPKTLQKLRDELKANGIDEAYIRDGKLKLDDLQSLDYLNCCVKESLRFDSPAPDAFPYAPVVDVEI